MSIRFLAVFLFAFISFQDFAFTADPAPPPAPVASSTSSSDRQLRWGLGFYLSTAKDLKADDATISIPGASAGVEIEYGAEGAVGLLVEVMSSAPQAWGWSAGLAYESKREIDELSISNSNASISGSCTSDCPEFSIGHIYGNAIYRWEQFYLPFGLNISFMDYDASGGETTTVKSMVGIQVGGGYLINDNFAVEGLIKVLQVDAKSTIDTTVLDFGTTSLTGLNLVGKYFF